jgi:hypothetical protein
MVGWTCPFIFYSFSPIKIKKTIFIKTNIMSSKFFGNSKVKSTQGEKNKKVVTPRASKRTTAVRKTGRGK